MTIRPFRLEDYDALVALWGRAGLEHRPEGRDSRDAIAAELGRGSCLLLVVEGSDGELVGSALATFDGRKGWINRIAVAPEARRQGLARRLLAAAEAELRGRGARIISALVHEGNGPSRKLLENAGYEHWPEVCYFRKVESPEV